VVARYLWWVEGVWFLPYALFWVWLVATCVRLLRRPHDLMRPAGT
jgi:membrane protein implicated in regulation of membrane protease activity